MSSAPVGVQSTLISSLGEFLGYWAGWYPGLPPVLVSIAFPIAFHISVFFHSLFFACHWISFVFLLYDRRTCNHSVDPSLTHLLGLRLALVPDVVAPQAEPRCA